MKTIRDLLMPGLLLCLVGCGDSGPATTQEPTAQAQAPPEAAPCELVMGWDPWEPYQYEIADGQVFGLDVDLLTAVAHNAGCSLSFRKGTWRELLQQIQAGDIDLLGGATRTEDREAFAWFTDPYRDEQFALYVPATRLELLGEQSFDQMIRDGLRFGVIEDYLYGDPVTALQDDPETADQFEYASMAETNVARLIEGGVDGIIEDKYVGAAVIRHKNLGDAIARHPLNLPSSPVSIMISRASVDEALFNRINDSVNTLRNNGGIDKVLAQYQNP